jgi:hypothetical protein
MDYVFLFKYKANFFMTIRIKILFLRLTKLKYKWLLTIKEDINQLKKKK